MKGNSNEHRSFLAVTVSTEVREELESLQHGLPEVRWTPFEQMHITLKFLGDVSTQTLETLQQEVMELHIPSFTLRFAGLGTFLPRNGPPVLWAGLESEEALQGLFRNIESMAGRLGIPKEKRPFKPHLTLGRLRRRQPERLKGYMELHEHFYSSAFDCKEVVLFVSRLTPARAIHEAVAVAELT